MITNMKKILSVLALGYLAPSPAKCLLSLLSTLFVIPVYNEPSLHLSIYV